MRITIGGILFMTGIGFSGFWLIGSAHVIKAKDVQGIMGAIKDKVQTAMGLFNSATNTVTPEPIPSTESVKPLTPVQEPVVATAVVEPAKPDVPAIVEPVPSAATPAKKKRRRQGRKQIAAAAVVAAPIKSTAAPVKKVVQVKPATNNEKSLVGEYVVLTLKTNGREVKGVLLEKSTVAYKLELPGLGAFTYPAENVKDVRKAE